MLKSSVQSKILKTLPDDRPITAIQIVENLDQCPRNFYPINKTYDQDSDADLGERSIFNRSTGRYLCLSKTEGIPNFVVQEIIVLNEKTAPPKGFSLLNRTADTGQRAWKKKQICYRLVNQKESDTAITDIIVCSRLRKAPVGFSFGGEVNGVILCYKMGNAESGQTPPERPPKPLSPNSNPVYPSLGGDSDNDYEILRPGPGYGLPGPGYGSPAPGYGPPASGYGPSIPSPGPVRPAPKPPAPVSPMHPLQHQTSTLGGSAYFGLEGVPFVVNPRFAAPGSGDNKLPVPKVKPKTMQQILKEYDYPFTIERQTQ